jgi:gamma-glutamyltranspeptidase/glutathione hydrolase
MFTTRPEITGTFGVAASTHWLATGVAMSVLERGGNAFDAAVAAGFTLQVVEPHLNGPGGEVPMLIAPAGHPPKVVCGQGVAPHAASISAFKELGLDMVPGTGLLATVVPGAFDAWLMVLRDYGTWTLSDVLAPALYYLEHGQPLLPTTADVIFRLEGLFKSEWPTSAAVYLPGGSAPKAGALFRNPKLAETYRKLAAHADSAEGSRETGIEAARTLWREGFVTEAIDRFCATTEAMDTSGERHRGLLTGNDIAAWFATYEDPVTFDYHGLSVCKTGPWGQGPVFLQQLALLAGFEIGRMDPSGPDFIHTVVESAKLAFYDR